MKVYIPFVGGIDLKKLVVGYLYFFQAIIGNNAQKRVDQFGFPEQGLSEQKKWIEKNSEVRQYSRCVGEHDPYDLYTSEFSEPCKVLFESFHLNRTLYRLEKEKYERNVFDFQNYMPPPDFNGEILLFIYSRQELKLEKGRPAGRIDVRSISQKPSLFPHLFNSETNTNTSSKIIDGENIYDVLDGHCCLGGYTVVARASDPRNVCYTFFDNLQHHDEQVREALRVYDRKYVQKLI